MKLIQDPLVQRLALATAVYAALLRHGHMANLNALTTRTPSRRGWELEAASKTAAFLRREFGLSPDSAEAEMHGEVLTICLPHALSPLGRVLARTPEGVEALETVYALLHEAHHAPLEALVSRIVGMKAGQSHVELDCQSGDVWVRFHLSELTKKED